MRCSSRANWRVAVEVMAGRRRRRRRVVGRVMLRAGTATVVISGIKSRLDLGVCRVACCGRAGSLRGCLIEAAGVEPVVRCGYRGTVQEVIV